MFIGNRIGNGFIQPPSGGGGDSYSMSGVSGIKLDLCAVTSDLTSDVWTSNVTDSDLGSAYTFDATDGVNPMNYVDSGASSYWITDNAGDALFAESTTDAATFLKTFHNTDTGTDRWCGIYFEPPAAGWTSGGIDYPLFGNQNDNDLVNGWRVTYRDTTNGTIKFQIMNGTAVTAFSFGGSASSQHKFVAGTTYLLLFKLSHSGSDTTIEMFFNSANARDSVTTALTSTDDADPATLTLGNDDSPSTNTDVGVKYYWMGMGGDTLTRTDINTIRDALEGRRELGSKIWADAPTDLTGLKVIRDNTSWTGWLDIYLYDGDETDVSQTILNSAGSKGDTSWDDTTVGEWSTDSTYSSNVSAMNDDDNGTTMWSTNASSGMIGWLNFNGSLDELSKVTLEVNTSGSYSGVGTTFEDKDGNTLTPVWSVTNNNGGGDFYFG